MTYPLIVSLLTNFAVFGALLWFLARDRDHQTALAREQGQERDDFRKALLLLVEHADTQRKEAATTARMEREALQREAFRERQVMMERIQRPEQVPAQAAPDPSPEPLHISVDDDEGFWEHRGVSANAG